MKKLLVFVLLAAMLLTGCDLTISSSRGEITGENATLIELSDNGITVKGGGAKAAGNVVTIASAGEYSVSGTIADGRIVVNTGEDPGRVILTLDNANITSLDGGAISVEQAKDLRLNLAEGSVNTLTSGFEKTGLIPDDTASGAALYSRDDMDIEGSGELNIFGYINNGITCKDDLDINSGRINIVAVNNGIKGAESVDIKGGVITVTAGNDGVKSTCTDKEGKGKINLLGGSLTVDAAGDGIQAETGLTLSGGIIHINSGKNGIKVGNKNAAPSTAEISGGELFISAYGDGIDAKGTLIINGGDVLALGNSKKVKGFSPDSSQAFVQTRFTGGSDMPLSLTGEGVSLEYTPYRSFNTVVCSLSGMSKGGTYTLTYGNVTAQVAAE